MIIRFFLVIIAVIHLQAYNAVVEHDLGIALCLLGNLPHRGLGMLYSAHIKYPHRADFAQDYLEQWVLLTLNERFIEGQTKPVVPMMSAQLARQFQDVADIQKVNKVIFLNHFGKVILK